MEKIVGSIMPNGRKHIIQQTSPPMDRSLVPSGRDFRRFCANHIKTKNRLKAGIKETNENPIAVKLASSIVALTFKDINKTPTINGNKQHKVSMSKTSNITLTLWLPIATKPPLDLS